ncbi:MAG: hypothetical protein HQL80_03215 [Magnetococcales bacterium]|nr:hypothetical protein [Magnetococcales bacterium]
MDNKDTVTMLEFSDESTKNLFKQSVWNLLEVAYSSVKGGLNFENIDAMVNETYKWILGFDQDKLLCVILSKKKSGEKIVAIGVTDNPNLRNRAKTLLATVLATILKRAWIEVSENAERFILKHVGEGQVVPNYLAERLTKKPIKSLCSDGYHYVRTICGIEKTKLIVGTYAYN